MRDALRAFDDAVDAAFTPLRGRKGADWVFYVASQAADYSLLWHAIGLTTAVVRPSKRQHAVRLAVALGIESVVVNGILKNIVKRERPAMLEDRTHEVRRPSTKSFPSGHASSAALTTVLLVEAMPKLRPLWLSLAAIVSASRIHNRMHHGSDVAAGTAIGVVFGLITRRLRPLC